MMISYGLRFENIYKLPDADHRTERDPVFRYFDKKFVFCPPRTKYINNSIFMN